MYFLTTYEPQSGDAQIEKHCLQVLLFYFGILDLKLILDEETVDLFYK